MLAAAICDNTLAFKRQERRSRCTATCLMILTMMAVSWTAMGMTRSRVATAMTASSVRMPAVWKRPKWSIGILIDTFGGGVGEGLAAEGSYQSGA